MPRINKPNGRAHTAAGDGGSVNANDAVARRAYEIYESRGGQHGFDLDHWLEAERELKPVPPKPRKAKKTPQAGA